MKKELIAELFVQFENAAYDYKGIECWSARELQQIFSYTDWRNFLKVIDKAKDACGNAGEKISDHFVDVNKMIDLALKKVTRRIESEDKKIAKENKKEKSDSCPAFDAGYHLYCITLLNND